ncbi:hypothetical protein [Kitasatospora sp. NPDC050463]|uniref:hypothetical protein n=1 Tax=Kitasatospora sp. NPDC050463 TaxID=3155786 RepID=UPI0033D5CCF5
MLGGDPCFDRMLDALPYRERFRRALGVRRGQRLLVLNSTWNPEGLFGDAGQDLLPGLLPRLTAELPADDYRVAAVLHPNIWYGHGPGQIRAWLDRARRNGLTLIDPVHSWRQALIAADLVLGDFGAVTYYAAALGTPVMLAADGQDRLDPESPVADFVTRAPRFDPYLPLRAQFEDLAASHRPLPGPQEFVTSAPGGSAVLLREHFYALLGLAEPEGPALLEPLPLPPYEPPLRTDPLQVRTIVDGAEIRIERSVEVPYGAAGDVHLAVHENTRDRSVLTSADMITQTAAPDDPRFGGPELWTAEVLRRHPRCTVAAYVTDPHRCVVRIRAHGAFQVEAGPGGDADPAAYASALYAWLASGGTVPATGAVTLRVHTAEGRHRMLVGRPEVRES